MLRLRRPLAAVIALLNLWPTLVLGQSSKAGVVTKLEGNVTVNRVATQPAQPLRFRDDVFLNDKIVTGDRALARMLLGGKAVVTVRERSALTITEIPGKSTIHLTSGKIALAVAKEKMQPGESIEIRAPNAIAAVRGTVVIAEVRGATADAMQGPAVLDVIFSVLKGIIEVSQIVPQTGAPVGGPVAVRQMERYRASGGAPGSVVSIPLPQVPEILEGLQSQTSLVTDTTPVANVVAFNTTVALVNALTGGGAQAIVGPPKISPALTEPTAPPKVQVPIQPSGQKFEETIQETQNEQGSNTTPPPGGENPPPPPPPGVGGAAIQVAGIGTLDFTFPAGTTTWGGVAGQDGPYIRFLNAVVSQSGGGPMIGVPAGSNVALNGVGLLEAINGVVLPSLELLNVAGAITQSAAAVGGTPALIDLVNAQLLWGNPGIGLLTVNGGSISGAGGLLRLTNGSSICASAGCGPVPGGALTQIRGGSVNLGGAFLQMFSAAGQPVTTLLTDNGILDASGGASLTVGSLAVLRDGAGVFGGLRPLFNFQDASASSMQTFIAIGLAPAAMGGSGAAPFVGLNNGLLHATATTGPMTFASGTTAVPRSFVAIVDGATVFNTAGDFLSFVGSPGREISVNATGNVMVLATTTADAPPPFLFLFDRLLYASSAHLTSGTPSNNASTLAILDGSTLSYLPSAGGGGELAAVAAAAPSLLEFKDSTVKAPGNVVSIRRSPSAALSSTLSLVDGRLLFASNTSFDNMSTAGIGGGPCCSGIFVGQGGVLLSSSMTLPLVELQRSPWTSTTWMSVEDACLGCLDTIHATTLPAGVSLGAGLLAATDSPLTSMFSGLFVRRSSFFGGTFGSPVFDLHSTVDTTQTFGTKIPAGFTAAGTVGYGALLNVTACVPGVGTCAGSLNPDGTPIRGDASVFLGGSLLRALADPGQRTTFNMSGDFVIVGSGASLVSLATEPLVVSNRSTFNVGTNTPALAEFAPQHRHFILANGIGGLAGTTPSFLSVTAPLLDSQNDVFNVGAGFLESSGGSAAATGPVLITRSGGIGTPLMSFNGSTVTLGSSGGGSGNVVDIRPFTGISSYGPVLQATGTGSTAPWIIDRFLSADCSGLTCVPGINGYGLETATFAGPTPAPMFAFSGGWSGAHTVNQEMFSLVGSTTTVESDAAAAGNLVATSQPVRHGGIMFSGSDTTINAQKVMRVDTALFEASAPLLYLTSNSTAGIASNALELVNAAKVKATLSGDALFKLNASVLNVLNGSLVSLSGSSFMTVVGNLLALLNGSTANITNGGLVSVSGTSVFKLTGGSLAAFGAGSNALNITGTSTGGVLNTSIAGLPVVLKNNASIGQVTVAPGFVPFSGGTPNFGATGAALVVDGTAAKVRLGP